MVTRGLYPRLVRRNVKKHLETMNTVGIENFVVEVVTVKKYVFIYVIYQHEISSHILMTLTNEIFFRITQST